MSVGIGVKGREVTFTLGGSTVSGVRTKSREFTNSRGETGDDGSSGWTEALGTPLEKSSTFSVEGLVKSYSLLATYLNVGAVYAVVTTYPDGSVYTQDYFLDSLSEGDTYNDLSTYSLSMSSSGEPTFVAGT